MDKLKTIFNGNPESGVGNVIRSGMAVMIPMMIGLGGAVYQNLTHPELGIIPPLVTMLGPTAIGILEMFRQFRITDRKNEEMDRRFFGNVRKLQGR
ncbi:conserved hypothetical protein [Candidatus Roizmanbacteria bacterium]|nr:conserved hypothetical protein [Candidatus Roizmanbacteria bacterium]